MSMIDIFKDTLQDGMEIVKCKEMANVYKITLSYNGMIGTCDLSKMCTPKSEKSLCRKSIDTAISGMYINAGNLNEAKEWLDGNKWQEETVNNSNEIDKHITNIINKMIAEYTNKKTYTDCEEYRRQGNIESLENLLMILNS